MGSAFHQAQTGRYEIGSQIGAGRNGRGVPGTGFSLDRKIALKVLPEDLASNGQRMQRFVQEAKAA